MIGLQIKTFKKKALYDIIQYLPLDKLGIKDKYNITEIESFPMKKAEEKKTSITYKIYAYDTRYCAPDKIKLEKEAKAIFSEISFMKLPSNANRYEIVFCCNLYNPNGVSFEYYK